MHLARFLPLGECKPRTGDVRGDEVVCFEAGIGVDDILSGSLQPIISGEVFRTRAVRFLMPYRPRVIFVVGVNYAAHQEAVEAKYALPALNPGELPCLLKGPASPVGPFDAVVRPREIECLDYEGELLVLVGADGQAGGYAVANDISARDVGDSWQLTRHKSGDTFCPWGPWVTTIDEIPDPYDLSVRTWVDGRLRQEGHTSEMLTGIDEIMEYVRKTIALSPGDAILTGTPAGTMAERDDPEWLQPGQIVEVEIEGLGRIANRVAAAPARLPAAFE